MIKYTVIFILLIQSGFSFSQIWEEPFDTLSYYDRLEKVSSKTGIKSYTVSDFDSSGNANQFGYYEFDNEGYLIKECQGLSSDQKLDTSYYFYNENGVFQEAVHPERKRQNTIREFIKDSLNRTIAITNTINDSISTSHYYYSKSGNLDSIKYQTGRIVIYKYTAQNKLKQKLIVNNGKMIEYFNYYHPNDYSLSYCNCNIIKVWDEEIAACDSTIGTYGKNKKIAEIESYFYKEDTPHFTRFNYDRKGKITRIEYEEPTGNASTKYYRNRKGLLIKIEHIDDKGKVYRYADFKYEYK